MYIFFSESHPPDLQCIDLSETIIKAYLKLLSQLSLNVYLLLFFFCFFLFLLCFFILTILPCSSLLCGPLLPSLFLFFQELLSPLLNCCFL